MTFLGQRAHSICLETVPRPKSVMDRKGQSMQIIANQKYKGRYTASSTRVTANDI